MSAGTWFVLFRRERTPAMADLRAELALVTAFRVRPIDDTTFSVTHEGAEVTVALDTAPHVRAESAEIAERAPPDRPDLREKAAAADARWEIVWDLAQARQAFDAFMYVGGMLRRRTGGVIYDQKRGEFV
jgi:hypothetical protein